MHAHDRFLPEWFSRIRSRQITLPRFQRFVAWGHSEVSGLLTTVLRGLPSGAALILEVGDDEKFSSRTMVDAPDSGEKVNEQLLDGQQRLTALWRSLRDKYEDRTYLVGFEEDPGNGKAKLPYVFGQARWSKNGKRYPVWADDPAECWQRGFIPISLLRPEDIRDEIDQWIEKAIPDDTPDKFAAYKTISGLISDLRINVREFNLPYLALPAKTPKEVALDVFIKMNTSSVKLSTYDDVVALVEDETGKSLHEHVDALAAAVPRATDYADLPSLVLDVVALRQDRVPSQAGYRGIDYTRMLTEWDSVVKGIQGMVSFLEDESIFDDQRLPSYTAIPIIAAIWEYLPTHPDQLGNARLCLLFIHPCAPNLISLRLPGPCRHDFVVCSCSRLCLQGSSRASSRESRSSAAARRAPPFGETAAALECRPRVLGAVVGASAVGSRAGAVLRRRGLSVSPRPVPKLGPFEIDHKSAA